MNGKLLKLTTQCEHMETVQTTQRLNVAMPAASSQQPAANTQINK